MTEPVPAHIYGARDGETFDWAEDGERLNKQMRAVFLAVMDREWHTLHELSEKTGHPEASISARLRDLRKPKFGAHIIEREYLGSGLHAYRYGGLEMERFENDD